MSKTSEEDLPVAPAYQEMLKTFVEEVGKDRVARLADVHRTTVWRNVSEGKLTYTTAMKLAEAIRQARKEDGQPDLGPPPPFIAILGQAHYQLAKIASELFETDVDRFGQLLMKAVELQNDQQLARANLALAHPIRSDDD